VVLDAPVCGELGLRSAWRATRCATCRREQCWARSLTGRTVAPAVLAPVIEPVEGAVADGGSFVDDEHGACVEWVVAAVAGPGEEPGEGFGEDPAFTSEVASGFGFDGGGQYPVAGGLPGATAARMVWVFSVPGRPIVDWVRSPLVQDAVTSRRCSLESTGKRARAPSKTAGSTVCRWSCTSGRVRADRNGGPIGPFEGDFAADCAFELDDAGGAEQFVVELFEGSGGDDEGPSPSGGGGRPEWRAGRRG
jgi:hypothetical protein